jgi:PAS domain S-box-containing protein
MSKSSCRKLVLICVFGLLLATGTITACLPLESGLGQPPVSTLRVVMDNNYPPYIFEDGDGRLRGILVDQWSLWEQKTGVDVEITALPWAEALERMKAGEFDVLDTPFYTEERAKLYDFTEPYTEINVRIFFPDNVSGLAAAEDLKGFRVAVKSGDANVDYLLERGVNNLVYYNGYEAIVQAAANHEETIFVIDEPPGFYFLYKYGIQSRFHYSEPLYSGAFHRAVKKGDAATLQLVERGFEQITPQEYQAIDMRWFGADHKNSLEALTPYLLPALVSIGLVIFILFIFNFVLRRRVRQRTFALQEALAELRESEQRFRDAIQFLPIPIGIANRQGQVLTQNQKFTDLYGYTVEDIPTLDAWEKLAYPEAGYRQQVIEHWQKDVEYALRNGSSTPLREYRIMGKDGIQHDVEIITHPVGELMITSFNDVTERKKVEEALRENETIFSSFLEHSPVYVFFKDKHIRSLRLSKNYEQMLGLPISAALGKTMDELFPSDLAKSMVDDDLRILNEGQRVDVVEELNGRVYETTKFPIFLDGKPFILAGFTLDITERVRSEYELRSSLERNRAIIAALPDLLFQIDSNNTFLDCIANDPDRLLLPPEQVIGRKVDEILPPHVATLAAEKIRATLQTGEMQVFDYSLDAKGQTLFFEGRMSPLNATSVLVLVRDITESRRAIEAIEQSEKRFRTLLENSADALTLLDADGLIVYEGPTVERITGYAPVERIGLSSFTNIYPDDLPLVRKTLMGVLAAPGSSANAVFRSVRKDGSIWWTEGTATNLVHDPHVRAIVINYRDITDRKQAEEQLRESETRYRALIEHANDAIFVENSEDQIVDVNRQACQMLGYTREELLQLRVANLIAPEIGRRNRAIEHEFAQYGNKPFESVDIRKDGARVPVEVTNTILPNGLALSIVRDITDRKRVEEALRESENRFRILFEHAGVGVARIDSNTGSFIQINQKYCDIVGFTRREMEALDFQTITHPEDLQKDLDLMNQLKKGEISEFTLEKRYLCKDGSPVWVLLIVSPLWKPGEAPSAHIAVVHDITERKRAESDLSNSEKRFRVLFENAGVGVAQGDTNTGRFLKINQKYCDIVGYTHQEMENLEFASITHPGDLGRNLELLEQLKRGEIPEFTMEKRYIRKDGSVVWVLLTVSPLWNPGEPPDTHITVIHDITEQKRAEYALRYSEAELRKLNAELEKRVSERTAQLELANHELEAFAYSVSHDLRAPLRAIDGFSRILMNEYAGELSAEAGELLERVRTANASMSQLVDALLGLSRMTRTEINRERIDLGWMARTILENLRQEHPERIVECVAAERSFADGDARLLRVALENLLGNAWKFTSKQERARIEFGIEIRGGETVYFVRDNGAGFNPRYADKLFGAFQRLHRTDEFEGTGIGLATVQRIIHRHGGRVWAESEVAKGATFYFTLG